MKRVRQEQFADGVLPAIHISGCPSSCAAHQTAIIGLRGGKKQTPDGPKDAFAIYVDGRERCAEEQFGEEIGVMTVENIPEYFARLGQDVSREGLDFTAYLEKYPERLTNLLKEIEE